MKTHRPGHEINIIKLISGVVGDRTHDKTRGKMFTPFPPFLCIELNQCVDTSRLYPKVGSNTLW